MAEYSAFRAVHELAGSPVMLVGADTPSPATPDLTGLHAIDTSPGGEQVYAVNTQQDSLVVVNASGNCEPVQV